MFMSVFMGHAGHLAEQHGPDAETTELRQNADRIEIELPTEAVPMAIATASAIILASSLDAGRMMIFIIN